MSSLTRRPIPTSLPSSFTYDEHTVLQSISQMAKSQAHVADLITKTSLESRTRMTLAVGARTSVRHAHAHIHDLPGCRSFGREQILKLEDNNSG